MKQRVERFNLFSLNSLVALVNNNRKTTFCVGDTSLIPFVLSFFKKRKFLSVSSVDFDDVVGSFALSSHGFFAVPLVDNLNKGGGVFDVLTYHEFLFNQVYYASFSSFFIDVCVYDSLVLERPLFKPDVGDFLTLSPQNCVLKERYPHFIALN